MADTETDVSNAEGYASWDTDDILIVVGASILGVVALAFFFDYKSLALTGVGLIGSFTSPISAGFNGFATLITDFFNWAGHSVSSLFISPAMVQMSMAKAYASAQIAMRLHLSVYTSSGYSSAIVGA